MNPVWGLGLNRRFLPPVQSTDLTREYVICLKVRSSRWMEGYTQLAGQWFPHQLN